MRGGHGEVSVGALQHQPPYRINAGCGTWYADGWLNTDVWINDDTRPDLLVTDDDPLPFPDASASHIFLGHVLEHIPWPQVPGFIAEVRRVLQPDGELLVVGPDVFRTIQRWHEGVEPFSMVESTMEHSSHFQPSVEVWAGARHHWNCFEQRVVDLLTAAGFVDVVALELVESAVAGWPVVGFAKWQFAVSAKGPT